MNAFRRHLPMAAALVSAAVWMAIPGASLHAQTPRPMGLVDLLNVPRLGDPQLSPDGRDVVFTRAESDWKSGRRITHIWRARVGTASGDPVQLTNGAESETAPRWSPDGKTVAFTAKRGDNEFAQIYLLPVDGGEARQLTTHGSAVSDISWTPDGSALYFTAPEPKTVEDKAREKSRDDVYAYDENYKQTHLWKVNVADSRETRLTDGDFSVRSYELSEDGRKIVYERAPTPLLGDSDKSEIWVANADGSAALEITKNRVPEGGASLSPDNTQVLFTSGANASFQTYYNGRLFVAPAAGGAARVVVGEGQPLDVDSAVWSTDGKSIYFLANLGVHEELFVVPAAGGTPKQLTNGKHNIGGISRSASRFALTVGDSTTGPEVYVFDATRATAGADGNADAMQRVTHVFDYLARDFKLGRQEAITWKGTDGVTVEGILTYPVDYQAGRKYPLVVMTHGGPQAADKYSIGSSGYEIQVLAGKGYAILQPNYRGSTGYGDAFLRDMVGHYFEHAHLDVMAGVDDVIRRGIANPDEMVKMGWSAGGHMTNKIITFTDRFKAAASGAGVAQWTSMYAQSDVRYPRTPWFGGTPWQKDAPIDVYWNNSPLKDVSNVKTPTIFFVGERDPRVPMPQSIEMYRALKSNNVPTHLYVAPREPHGWAELRHNLYKMNAEIAWFEKYATKRAYTWEKAPGEDKKDTRTTSNQQQ